MSNGGWNYRVIVKHSDHPINKGERYFEIHECYYANREDTLLTMHMSCLIECTIVVVPV